SNDQYRWVSDQYPAQAVSLRSAGADKVVIQAAEADGRPVVIGEVDRATAPVRVHTGAVYLHEGRSYVVEQLDWDNGLAHVKAEEVDSFTRAPETVEMEIVGVAEAKEAAEGEASPEAGDAPEPDDWDAPAGRVPPRRPVAPRHNEPLAH